MDDSQDDRARYLALEEKLRKAAEENSLLVAENNSLAAEKDSLAAENTSLAEKNRQNDELLQSTTFTEYIRHCHESLSKPLRVASLSACVKGAPQAPIHKSCPRLLKHWTECEDEQGKIYRSVCKFLEQKRLFERIIVKQGNGKQVEKNAIGSEKDLKIYERSSVENHVAHIITALCGIPAAQETFHLGSNGISFKNHSEGLQTRPKTRSQVAGMTTKVVSRPDSFCVHDNGQTKTLRITGEYKAPHKLHVAKLRVGLQMEKFYEKLVLSQTIPREKNEKFRYDAARLAGAAIVQQYHSMMEYGIEYGYITTGLGLVLLRIPYENPGTIYYHLCEPNVEVDQGDTQCFLRPVTAIARVLCLCLMSLSPSARGPEWRTEVTPPTWKTGFDEVYREQSEQFKKCPKCLECRECQKGPKCKTCQKSPKCQICQKCERCEKCEECDKSHKLEKPFPSRPEYRKSTRKSPTRTRSRTACKKPTDQASRDDTDPDLDPAPGSKRCFGPTASPTGSSPARQPKRPKGEHNRPRTAADIVMHSFAPRNACLA